MSKTATTKITYNRDYNEYRVRLFIDGVYQAGGDSFQSCKEDAKDAAAMMIKECAETDKTAPEAIAEQADYDGETRDDEGDDDEEEEEEEEETPTQSSGAMVTRFAYICSRIGEDQGQKVYLALQNGKDGLVQVPAIAQGHILVDRYTGEALSQYDKMENCAMVNARGWLFVSERMIENA